jgi:hypothetical protein
MKQLLVLLLLGATPLFAADAPTRPPWCHENYICIPRHEVAEATIRLIDLKTELALARAKARRMGLTVGVGMGVGGVVDDSFQVRVVPTGGVFVVYGWRF